MNARLVVRALFAVVLIVAFGWLGTKECCADLTIASIEQNDQGMISVGSLTFTFFTNGEGGDTSVSSDTFDNKYVVTAANVGVTTVGGGLQFTFNPTPTLGGATSQTDKVTITYSVADTVGIASAGLSFGGSAEGDSTASSSVTEMLSDGTMMKVFTMDSGDNVQNNQSAAISNLPMTLTVTDTGQLSIPTRGNGATSSTQLTSITNTFNLPEPSSFVVVSFTALVWLGVWWRGCKRVAARA